MLTRIKILTKENMARLKYIDVFYKKYPNGAEVLLLADDVFNSLLTDRSKIYICREKTDLDSDKKTFHYIRKIKKQLSGCNVNVINGNVFKLSDLEKSIENSNNKLPIFYNCQYKKATLGSVYKFRECIDGGYKFTYYRNDGYEINITNVYEQLHNEFGAAIKFYDKEGVITSFGYALNGNKITEQQWEEQVKTKLYW